MNFAEIRFWTLLAAGIGLIAILRPLFRARLGNRIAEYDRWSLMSLGVFLLACVSLLTLTIFVLVALGSYVGTRWIVRHPRSHHKWYLIVIIPLLMSPLLYYKYANFVLNQVLPFEFSSLRDMLIPVGISFYTFQKIAFIIDTLAFNQPIPRFVDYINFACFFPQIVAGPIERRRDLLPQMETFTFRWSKEGLNQGVTWIALGLFFKLCLADNIALFFRGWSVSNPYLIWLDNLIFGLRIYYDFAGYSLVAVGLGRCIGIRLTLNFLSPYCSTSIIEFWRRWHVTLSQWFRDYVYVPLGGGRHPRWWLNIAIVFIVSGIWHGAGWNFILWGALHATFLILNRALGSHWSVPAPLAWGCTFLAAFFAWLSFYETRTSQLLAKMGTLLTPTAYGPTALREALTAYGGADLLTLSCFLILIVVVMVLEWRSVAKANEPYLLLRRPWLLTVLVILTVLLAPGRNNAFIYFAF